MVLLVIELAAVGSTVALSVYLVTYKDGQNGIVLIFFPAVQLVAVFIAGFAAIAIYSFWESRRSSG